MRWLGASTRRPRGSRAATAAATAPTLASRSSDEVDAIDEPGTNERGLGGRQVHHDQIAAEGAGHALRLEQAPDGEGAAPFGSFSRSIRSPLAMPRRLAKLRVTTIESN